MILQFGVLCTFLTITQRSKANSSVQDSGLTCKTNYWLTIDCFLNSSVISHGTENDSNWLEFQLKQKATSKPKEIFNCSLLIGKDHYTCNFTAKIKIQSVFMVTNVFDIHLCSLENGHKKSRILDSAYSPAKHIKPITPYNMTMQYAAKQYTFRWISGYENHTYAEILPFQYILSYHKEGYPDTALRLNTRTQTMFNIPEDELEPGTEYIAKVCSEVIPSSSYDGTKSLWSYPVKWSTLHTGIYATPVLNSWSKIIIPICLAVVLTFLLIYPVASRMKIKVITWLSTPTPYLHSLHHKDHGSFQGRGLKGHMQQNCSEEISTIDMISELTAVKEDPVKICNKFFIAQCRTPYVGPSVEAWVPFKMQEPGSETGMPCADINLLPDERLGEKPVCLQTDDADMGFLSLADLEPSDETSSPPVALTPNLACFTQNYCTLTNTAIGLIPTLSAGPHGPDLVADTHISTDLLKMQLEENTEVVTLTLDNLQLSMEE